MRVTFGSTYTGDVKETGPWVYVQITYDLVMVSTTGDDADRVLAHYDSHVGLWITGFDGKREAWTDVTVTQWDAN